MDFDLNRYQRRAAPFPFPPHAAGRYYANTLEVATTTLAVAANTLYAVPLFIPSRKTYTTIGVELQTGGASNGRFGIYEDDGAGAPGALILDAGVASLATPAGFKSKSISQVLDPGLVWLAVVADAAAGTFRVTTQSSCLRFLGFSSGTDTTPHPGWSVAFTYGALPDPFQAGGALMTGNAPRIMLGV